MTQRYSRRCAAALPALAALSGAFAGCTGPLALHPEPGLPGAWQYAADPAAASWPGEHWTRDFGSSELDALVAEASSTNQDLAAAQARVRQADARRRGAGAALLPAVAAGASFTNVTGRSSGISAHENDYGALLSASYEADFWGGKRAARDAASHGAAAARADHATLAVTITAAVANEYFQVLGLHERLGNAGATLAAAEGVLQVVQARFDAGGASAVELSLQQAEVARAQLAIPPLAEQEAGHSAALAVLTGHLPEGFELRSAVRLAEVHELRVTAGLPSGLLARRPDVQAAESNLQAAHADVAVARAALFPAIALTASGGVQNPGFQAVLLTLPGTGTSLAASASLLQSVFDGGRRRAMRAEAEAREQELLADYRSAILHAFADVEMALASVMQLERQAAAQREALERSEQALAGARARYVEGAGDFLVVLDAQRTLYAARDLQIQYQLARLQAQISLCKALGGGWQPGRDGQ